VVAFVLGEWSYTVDVSAVDSEGRMTQTNAKTGTTRHVRRIGVVGEAALLGSDQAPVSGPLGAARLAVLLLQGRLGSGTSVWAPGMGERSDRRSWRAVTTLMGVPASWFSDTDDHAVALRESRPAVGVAQVLHDRLLAEADALSAREARAR
jgi:hypothetical protein